MAFDCPTNQFSLSTTMHTSVPMLAVSFYHELKHAADCYAGRRVVGNVMCENEEPAHAAQVRFFTAMYAHKLIPVQGTVEDLETVQMISDVHQAIVDRNFCGWYRAMLNRGVHAPPVSPVFKVLSKTGK
jgi:hypothetical protein